mgnify:CR=1 FL=1
MFYRPALLVLNLFLLVACATVDKQQRTSYGTDIEADSSITLQQSFPGSVIRVATLNLAHGRKDSVNQLFVLEDTFRDNLADIAAVLSEYRPHVVALQEADAASRWSGGFDHVQYLAKAAGYPWRIHESNAESWLFSFGTALLSALPLSETVKHTFEASPPTLDKGFVLAQINWTNLDSGVTRTLDILSVHLDFSRQSVREQQIDELLDILSDRMNPTIIMGDFNSEWLAESSVIQALANKSRFTSYRPTSSGYNTYKAKRLDWILITKDLEFVDYQVLPDTLSDHAMVLADIRFKGEEVDDTGSPITELDP